MKRREALPLTLLGLASLPGCDFRPSPVEKRDASSSLEGSGLPPVRVGAERQIRVITGLRPFRPSGFVVKREQWEGKTVIHNYGHGGGGFTLSWGSSHLAIALADPVAGKACAVIGGGVMGLSVARLLQARGAAVTLYTRDLPPQTTSNIAGAQCWPVSVFDRDRRTDAFAEQFVAAANVSFRSFQDLVGPRWGVRWVPNYYLSEEEPENGWMGGPGGALHHMQVGFRDFGPGEHAFPANYVRRFHTLLIEPATYLSTLQQEVRIGGARVEIRTFANLDEVLSLPEDTVFNCSGLGSKELFPDDELVPIKGQLNVLLPQPEVDYNLIAGNLYMFSRSDGVVLGGTFERGNWDASPDEAVSERMLAGHRELFAGFPG